MLGAEAPSKIDHSLSGLVASVEIEDCFALCLDVDLELSGVVDAWPGEKVVLE